VLGIETLRNKFSRYEARRKLLQSYDLFLCDESLSLVLRKFLGKNFFKSKKYPIPIKMSSNLCENVAKARDATYLYISQGSTLNVRIAHSSMDDKNICENIFLSLDKIVDKIPGKWKNIKSLGLKTKNSMCLPFYNNILTISFDKEEINEEKKDQDNIDEEKDQDNIDEEKDQDNIDEENIDE